MVNHSKFIILFIVLLSVLSCKDQSDYYENPENISDFRDIPGITNEEILAIESLKEKHDHFLYGMIYSTEAFTYDDDTIGGYSAIFCDYLTKVFGIKFIPKIEGSFELIKKLDSGEIHFSGNMMPNESRLLKYYMTDTIAERQFIIVRLADTPHPYDITPERKVKYLISKNTPVKEAIDTVTDSETFEVIYINDTSEAYEVLKKGTADAYIGTNIVEIVFA